MNRTAIDPLWRRQRLVHARLYVILTQKLIRGSWSEVVKELLAGGAEIIQLRVKDVPSSERARLASSLMDLVAPTDSLLIVNDDPVAAALARTDGVHLGDDDPSPARARDEIGDGLLIGRSTHSFEDVLQVVQQPIDYLAIGSIYASSTKQARAIVGPQILRRIQREVPNKWFAIGGITRANIHEVLACGGDAIALSSAILSAADIAAETAWFRSVLDAPR